MLWQLGPHRLLCGDARQAASLDRLLEDEQAAMAFLDPPSNLRGGVGHRRSCPSEVAMAPGEMSRQEFLGFLIDTLGNAATHSRAGAIHYVGVDWRRLGELLEASQQIYGEMLAVAVWVKPNARDDGYYRSQHELIGVFRAGEAPHPNNTRRRHGRSRSNVWRYAGVKGCRPADGRAPGNPTVKPVALVADAMKDCTRRQDIVLDPLCGLGTTVLAAERVGRRAYALELEPRYVDVTIRRWQAFTRRDAVHIETGSTFDERALGRLVTPEPSDGPHQSQHLNEKCHGTPTKD